MLYQLPRLLMKCNSLAALTTESVVCKSRHPFPFACIQMTDQRTCAKRQRSTSFFTGLPACLPSAAAGGVAAARLYPSCWPPARHRARTLLFRQTLSATHYCNVRFSYVFSWPDLHFNFYAIWQRVKIVHYERCKNLHSCVIHFLFFYYESCFVRILFFQFFFRYYLKNIFSNAEKQKYK